MPPPSRKTPSKPAIPTAKPMTAVAPPPIAAPAPVIERSEMKGSGKPKMPTASLRQPTYAEIEKRAFEIYAGRGYAPGDPTADWFEAERQLKAGL